MAVTSEIISADLCGIKPDKKLIDLGDTKVKIKITLDTKKPPAPATMKRLKERAVEPLVTKYRTTIEKSVDNLERKVKALTKAGDATAANTEANACTHAVQSACKALQAAVDKAVKAQVKADAKSDTNLAEAKVKVGISVAFHVVIAASDVARVGASAGGDVQAATSLFTQIMDIAEILNDQMAKAPKLLADLRAAYDEYLQSRILKDQAKTSAAARTERFVEQLSTRWKGKAATAEESRKRFRDEVTQMRQNLEKMSKQTVKYERALAGLKVHGVDIAKKQEKVAKLRAIEAKTYRDLGIYEQNLDNMSKMLAASFKQHGSKTQVDDRTFSERFGELDSWKDVGLYGGELLAIAGEIAHMGA